MPLKAVKKKKKSCSISLSFTICQYCENIKSQVTTTMIFVVSLNCWIIELFVLVVLTTVLHAVSAADSHRAEWRRRPPARWWALRRPHQPQHLPRAWVHHRLHGQTGRAHVPSQMVTPPLPSSSFFSLLHPRMNDRGWVNVCTMVKVPVVHILKV